MTFTHLETMNPAIATHSRKTQRVYKSPSDANEPSPFSKAATTTTNKPDESKTMDIDAEDEEAGTILMALAQHANRIKNHPYHTSTTYDEKPTRSNSMSIRNLLDPETDASIIPPHVSPYHSLSSESIYHEKRQNRKKGFQICLTPRRNPVTMDDRGIKSFRHPSIVRAPLKPNKSNIKYKRNTTHIHISYRIHAHRTSLTRPYETASFSSAFRPPPNHQYWNMPPHPSSPYHYQQDPV